MEQQFKKQRVIGIRHALKDLKNNGLISEQITFPSDASNEIIELIIKTAIEFYELGSKTGVEKTLNYILNEKYTTYKRNGRRKILADFQTMTWQHTFPVQAGYSKSKVIKSIRIPIKELGFES
ncbi:hypothetical protein [Aeromonas bivalvium]|uniref:hypothetical protein n=1 Tax=Aeromonas bivalvium TaxID=440079 RepID=UPI0038D23F56